MKFIFFPETDTAQAFSLLDDVALMSTVYVKLLEVEVTQAQSLIKWFIIY
jgi:hypothetical protein